MGKIGRNEKCPCRSGKKFKHCCALKAPTTRPQAPSGRAGQLTLTDGVRAIQEAARRKKAINREVGVFFLYSTEIGDAWLLEMTDCDCVQVAKAGEAMASPLEENSETIELNYSHTFALRDKRFEIIAYADKAVQILEDAPAKEINAAIKRIRKRFSEEQLRAVHLPAKEDVPG